jgi:glucosamine--fructose-6-phosphate aminotransferase (isomerizing)
MPAGYLGIGHTRWATHGVPNHANAHPHTDCSGRIVVVHNGIIENYAQLRDGLIARGHVFTSETDTEVVAHLIEEEGAEGPEGPEGPEGAKGTFGSSGPFSPFVEAVRRALAHVRGAYAIAAFTDAEPDLLVGARQFSPLVVGLGEGENYLASDIPALLGQTRRAMIVEDGELVVLRPDGVEVLTLDGQAVSRPAFHVNWDAQAAEKGGFPHFVLKEIYEQPAGLRNALRGRLDGDRLNLVELGGLDLRRVERVYVVACGTSAYAGLVGKLAIEAWARLPVEVAIASEFRYSHPVLDPRTLVVLISQSGETADTLAGFRLAKEAGCPTVALTNVVGSSLTRAADAVLYLQVGPEIGVVATKSFTAQLVLLYLLALSLAEGRGLMSDSARAEIVGALRTLPGQVETVLAQDDAIASVARAFSDRRSFFYFGRGFGYPVALEGALKLKEISYIHAEGYPAGELKHGPIAMLDPDIPVMAIATQSPTYDKVLSNIQEVLARRARVLAVATAGDDEIGRYAEHVFFVPPAPEALAPVLAIIPLQLFSYHVAVARGCDVDQPRNLAKSVTVE